MTVVIVSPTTKPILIIINANILSSSSLSLTQINHVVFSQASSQPGNISSASPSLLLRPLYAAPPLGSEQLEQREATFVSAAPLTETLSACRCPEEAL